MPLLAHHALIRRDLRPGHRPAGRYHLRRLPTTAADKVIRYRGAPAPHRLVHLVGISPTVSCSIKTQAGAGASVATLYYSITYHSQSNAAIPALYLSVRPVLNLKRSASREKWTFGQKYTVVSC
jgi:hypothetical protein